MPTPTLDATSGTPEAATDQRYRLPGITREGIAQLSLLETALWPLGGGLVEGETFETAFADQGRSREARVSVYSPHGLQSVDEYVLWGLLGICLSRKQPEPTLLATPYWIIKRLGMSLGGCQYDQFRSTSAATSTCTSTSSRISPPTRSRRSSAKPPMEKYRLTLNVANQYLAQMDEATMAAVFGNVGSLLAFQVGAQDAEVLAQQLGGDLLPRDLLTLPRYRPYARLLIDGMPSRPFSLETIPPPPPADPGRAAIIRRTSRHRYATPAVRVEQELIAAFA